MKSILIGSVGSSRVILNEMINIGFPINMVYSLDEEKSEKISGYEPIHELARTNGIPFRKFSNINDEKHVREIELINPDYIFVIGLSQLVNKRIIDSAKKGTIGFHPTDLPKYRGRAAIVWQILLGVKESKCSLFFIDEGVDSGDIIDQEEYIIDDNDYALDVLNKCRESLKKLAIKTLPRLLENSIEPVKQNEEEATYLLKRTPDDGLINWHDPIEKIQRLIRATSRPYPGAFSMYRGKYKVIFWKADIIENSRYYGLPGQVVAKTDEFIDIICIDGLLRVYDFQIVDEINIVNGNKFK